MGEGVTYQLVEGECLFSSVLVQGLYQLICSAALPQNLSGSATEAAKWVLYSQPPEDSARQPRPPRAPRGPGATYALRAGPAPRAGEDAGRDPPSPPAPVTLRHCSQDGFIAAGGAPLQAALPAVPSPLLGRPLGRSRLPGPQGEQAGGGGKFRGVPRAREFGSHTGVAGKNRPGAAREATGCSGGGEVGSQRARAGRERRRAKPDASARLQLRDFAWKAALRLQSGLPSPTHRYP